MKFYLSGKNRVDALDRLVEISPISDAKRSPLNRLDYMLGFIKERRPENYLDFVDSLSNQYQAMLKMDYFDYKMDEFTDILSDFPHLMDNLELAKNLLNYLIQILELPESIDLKGDSIEVKNKNRLLFHLHPRYYKLLTLTQVLGRDDGISLYKRFFTQFLIDTRDHSHRQDDGLEILVEERKKSRQDVTDWPIVFGLIADGKYAYKNLRCIWVEALEDLPDSELKYYVCCYGDYEGVRNRHESMVLTMEHTIAQGDPYCSRVIHDTRVDWDLRHPSREFWDNMNPTE